MNRSELKRKICETATSRGGREYTILGNNKWLLCWNVKVSNVDFSYGNLKRRGQAIGYWDESYNDPIFEVPARTKLSLQSDDYMLCLAIGDARESFVDQDGLPGDHGWRYCTDGAESGARFAFLGRSGGWLVLCEFKGVRLCDEDSLEFLQYEDLIRLLAFAQEVACIALKVTEIVEEKAAFDYFHNTCSGIKTRDEWHKVWTLDFSGEH